VQILVIDDDEISRELLTLLLEVEGFKAVSAASGDEGIALLTQKKSLPEAVLSDLQMPGLSGTDLALALRAVLPSGVPIIAMSGSDSRPAGTPAGAPAGFDGFLLKPFAVADLRATLADVKWQRGGGSATIAPRISPDAHFDLQTQIETRPALNEEVFQKMQELMPPTQLGQMYALCIADARTRVAAMRVSSTSCDEVEYRREAHAIKGGAGMIGAEELYELATEAEQAGLDEGDLSAGTSRVTARFDQLSRACERLERILVERLQP
jgi:CheY-like chemotaxis protein/HPt (histidine-containing phosphotransfer) domain-containing protein